MLYLILYRNTSQNDCFVPLREEDFKLLHDLFHHMIEKPLPYKLTKNPEIIKMVSYYITAFYEKWPNCA